MKKMTVVFVTICLLAVAVTVADYTGLFGTETSTRLDFAEARFRIVEAGTGAPIFRTRVKCVQKGNDNACTLKDTLSDDVLSLLFPRHIRVTESLLFTLNEETVKPAEPDVHIFFINPDYGTVNMTLPIMDILEDNAGITRVEMQGR
jgi:hypothetical protein